MKLGEIIELDIVSNGMNGEGVARCEGKPVFVPYAVAGERVRAVFMSVKKNYAFATVIKVLSPSEYRVKPTCPYYFKCGGCDMGHLSPDYRQSVLMAELSSNFKKIARLDVFPSEFIDCADKKACRNKLSMPFGSADGKVVLGLYRQNTHVVEPVECEKASDAIRSVCATVCAFATKKKLSVYNEATGRGLLRHAAVRAACGRAALTLVINGDGFDGESELAELLPDTVDLFVCPNTKRNNVIMGDTVRLIKGNARLKVEASGVKAELSPLSFFQVNDEIRDKLYAAALSALGSPKLIDLYSGIGITSNIAATAGKTVYAVECVPQAVADADRTATLNGNSDRIENVCGDVADVLNKLRPNGETDVLVDPPRKGCGAEVMRAISALLPRTLVYISCNHATMCRDVRAFLDASPDYEITDCRIFDMFPDTHHTETLAVLSRKNPNSLGDEAFMPRYDM